MLRTLLAVALASSSGGPLMFIGGGKDQDDLMKRFFELSGGADAPVVVIPLASDDPVRSGKAYVAYFAQLGHPKASYLVPKGEPAVAELAVLAKAGGLFWSGGDQARIVKALTPGWRTAIAGAWNRGAAIAGTSAGAMVWGASAIMEGDPMETGWYGEDPKHQGIRLGSGLGVAPGFVVDTHFSQRGRVPRLA
jgi:cyanophycinase